MALLVVDIQYSFALDAASGGWQLESSKNGIKIYTRAVEGSKLKQVRAVASVRAPMETVMRILTDYKNYKVWMNNVVESYVVDHPQDSIYYVYHHEDSPWPVKDRQHYDKMIVSRSGTTGTVAFKSMPNYSENDEGTIEPEWYEGWWKVSETTQGRCEIEYTLNENPGGYVPPWLVNFLAVDAPFNTMTNLKNRAERMNRS